MIAPGHLPWCMWLAILLVAAIPSSANSDGNSSDLEGDEIRRIDLVISERAVQLENNSVRVTRGDSVEMRWESDEAVKLHLHGYDIEFEITPGKPAVVRFEAHATGRFPITSHGFSGEHGHGHEALLYLEVYPD